MLTARGWWFLIIIISLLTVGAFDNQSSRGGETTHWALTLLALTLLLWFLAEWLLFALRVSLVVPAVLVRREVRDARGPVVTLWAGRSFQVLVQLQLPHWGSLPYLRFSDHVPFVVEQGPGKTEVDGALSADNRLALTYTVRCSAAGRIRFEGIALQLADFQGFFHHATFIPGVAEYRVLPPLADAEGHRPTVKRHNLLPSPGLHRHLRPGSGSELLDLRDYLPGDPPKTIAWKVSARRDRLITKEFESEVPVRCTLLLDTSHSVRVGPPGRNALAHLVEISAAVAQANAGARDLTGICLFDEQEVVRYMRPARGSRSLVQLLNVLADAAGLAPATGEARIATLLPMAYAFAHEVYPYLLQPDLNHIPSWSAWFWPVPTYPSRPLSLRRHIFRGLVLLLASLPLVSTGLLLYVFSNVFASLAETFVPVPESLRGIIGIALAASLLLGYYSGVLFVYRSLGLWLSPKRRRLARWRKRLAAILAERYGLAPGGLAILLENDEQFSLCMQRFLAEHQVPYPLPLYDRSGRYLFASPGKINVLARALVHAVGKGHDNELFVLLVDLLELVDRLEPLLGAVKMTLARHHQVLVICPWPPGVPPPPSRGSAERQNRDAVITASGQPVHSVLPGAPRSALRPPALVQQATVNRLHRAFARLQATFIRLGVPVICADSADPVRLILDRLDRLRALGVGGRR
jgi:uncharacterized protein (DUF58 family)